MRFLLLTIFVIFAVNLNATTPQDSDILIWQTDTIYLDKYPLEEFLKIKPDIRKRLLETDCISTGCWRNYIATWRIMEDKLVLVELRGPCDRNVIPLEKIFDKKDINQEKVVASWYTGNIRAGFGKSVGFSEMEFKQIYEKTILIEVKDGKVISTEVQSR